MKRVERLSMREGVELSHAFVSHLAQSNAIRSILIKGPGVESQQLRPFHQSSDVDVLVDPSDFNRFLVLLAARGWARRPTDPDGHRFPSHSIAYYHPDWPNDIDVHHSFPGIEVSPVEAFEILWRSHTYFELANRQIPIPDKESSRLILALHALRSLTSAREKKEYEYLVELGIENELEFLNLCSKLGALAAARPFLQETFSSTSSIEWPTPSQDWAFRVSSRSGSERRLNKLSKTQWKDIPRTVWRDLFPPGELLLMRNLYQDTSTIGMTKTYATRFNIGLRTLIHISQEKLFTKLRKFD